MGMSSKCTSGQLYTHEHSYTSKQEMGAPSGSDSHEVRATTQQKHPVHVARQHG